MKARKRLTIAVLATLGFVGVVIAALTVSRLSPSGLVVGLQQLHRPPGRTVTAQLALTNSSRQIMFLRCDTPQVRLAGGWKSWTNMSQAQDFCLQPGGVTNVSVSIPASVDRVRVPLLWGWAKQGSAFQTLAPAFRIRLANMLTTLRTSLSLRGWSNPYGYLPDGTSFYYITNAGSF